MTNDDDDMEEDMEEDMELIHGSGNVFRDLGVPNPEVEQLKAILAAKIIGVLDNRAITVRRAHELTGFAAADFSRVRNARLGRFTVDRLMAMLGNLDKEHEVEVSVSFKRCDIFRAPFFRVFFQFRLARVGIGSGQIDRVSHLGAQEDCSIG